MQRLRLGIVHPGNMGISIAASAQNSGCRVFWVSQGRGKQTRERAEKFDLEDSGTLIDLCRTCSVVVSVCPPYAAEDVADQIASCGFDGIYLDANAIAPKRAARIGEKVTGAGATFVDGGIIGGPAWEPGQTWLYLSGKRADVVADCFSEGPLEVTVLGDAVGQASALKMCYAAWTKGSTALLCAVLAAADSLGVWADLERQWERNWPGFAGEATQRARRVTAKAWRFAGEMEEIATTFEDVGLPGGFHGAAADLYGRMAHFKGYPSMPLLEDVLAALEESGNGSQGPTG
jgi:3-hydroxyisobutyrate dehydrogenase-like beta-hydroxyacid dehydrogenase